MIKRVVVIGLCLTMVGCSDSNESDVVTMDEIQRDSIERMTREFVEPQLFNRFLKFCKKVDFDEKYGQCIAIQAIIDERGSDEPMVIEYPDGTTSTVYGE